MIKVRGYPKKNLDIVHFCISQDEYPKRAYQDCANDVTSIISTSLNFAQIRKNVPKTPKNPGIGSASAKKRFDLHEKIVQFEEKTSGLSTGYVRFLYLEYCALWWSCVNKSLVQSNHDFFTFSWKKSNKLHTSSFYDILL